MACSVFRQVGATYKALWTKWYNNQEARARGSTTKRFKGLDQPPHYVSPTLTYVYGHDYSLRAGHEVSILTREGRIRMPYQGFHKHLALLQHGALIGGAKLWYDRAKKHFYLLVSFTIETPDPTPEDHRQMVGVDVGSRYLATVATLGNGAQFYSGKEVRSQADHYARLQKRLQQKGTRAATRRRLALSQRERRLKLNTNHTIAKQILDSHPSSLIGLEDLSGIRDRIKRKRGKRATKKQRRTNRHASTWAFAELQSFLAYKAVIAGSLCIKMDADYTSQACPNCGHTSKANRKDAGLLFVCQNCHYTLHADLIGARNICIRTLVIWQDWVTTGRLSDAPDVTDHEAKAARLQRFAELRWSPATSPLVFILALLCGFLPRESRTTRNYTERHTSLQSSWQGEPEGGTLARHALDAHLPLMPLDNGLANMQA